MRFQLEVVLWRGRIAESHHRFQVAACRPDGALAAATDDPHRVTTFRSAAKPFQLLPLVERGHAERWQWSDEELAVMAASHTGNAHHVRLVRGILDRMGLGDRHLACGYHEPLDPESRELLRAHPGERSPLYNNCSGKHAGMLCLALSEGWPLERYERGDHPVQQLMRRSVAAACGHAPEDLSVAVDGCSVSVFGMPLSSMARAYARLAVAAANGDPRERALARIREAMRSHPRVVGGTERLSTALMEAVPGKLVAKGGAEGLECVGVPASGLGLAIKCEDGHARGLPPALVAVLEYLGELTADDLERLAEQRRPVVHNAARKEVGAFEATLKPLSANP